MSSEDWKTKRSDTLYDYIKFHLGLYIATPTAYVLIGTSLGLTTQNAYIVGLMTLLATCLIAGIHASVFITDHLFEKWENLDRWHAMGEKSIDPKRRFLQHHLYWIGLILALICLAISYVN